MISLGLALMWLNKNNPPTNPLLILTAIEEKNVTDGSLWGMSLQWIYIVIKEKNGVTYTHEERVLISVQKGKYLRF